MTRSFLAPPTHMSQARKVLSRLRDDPVLFAREVLGVDPWDRQEEIFRAVADYDRVAVRSGHKIGKSTAASCIALWWWSTRRDARVIFTSASFRQVEEILWREMTRLYKGARFPLGGELGRQPSTGLRGSGEREIVGFSTREPERMAGFSGAELLIIADEASGIPNAIFEAIEGNRAGGAKLLMLSNPTLTSGYFFDAFHSKREFWHVMKVASYESPNVKAGRVIIPGLATAEWCEEKRLEWGEGSPMFNVRVEGDFPSQAENAVVPFSLVQAASDVSEVTGSGRLNIGVDVARFGDDESVIWPVRGLRGYPPVVLNQRDAVDVAGEVLKVARLLREDGEVPLVKVDEIGVGGGVIDVLRRNAELETMGINVSHRAMQDDFATVRDELWFGIVDWLKEGGRAPFDARTEAELAAVTYTFDAKGQYRVESKESLKRRLGRSPDRADALALAVYPIAPVRVTII